MNGLERMTGAAYAVAAICFFLPFVAVSCPVGQFSFTGVQMAVGTSVEQPGAFGQPATHKRVEGEPLVLGAAMAVVVGLLSTFLMPATARVAAPALGGLSAVLLLLVKVKIDDQVLKAGNPFMRVSFEPGFWGAVLCSVVAAVTSVRASPASGAGVSSKGNDSID